MCLCVAEKKNILVVAFTDKNKLDTKRKYPPPKQQWCFNRNLLEDYDLKQYTSYINNIHLILEDLKQYTSYIANEANRQAPSQAHSQVKGREPDGLRQAVCQPE